MDIRLLGSIEAWDADRLHTSAPRKQLARHPSALEVNRLVTVSRLVAPRATPRPRRRGTRSMSGCPRSVGS